MNRFNRLGLALSMLLVAAVASAYTLKDTLNPVAVYTGSNTVPSLNAPSDGSLTLGISTGLPVTSYNTMYGAIRGRVNNSTDQWANYAGGDGLELSVNSFMDAVGGRRALTSTGGLTKALLRNTTSSTTAVFSVDATTEAQTANSTASVASLATILSGTAGGAWTIGPLVTNNFNGQRHLISGGLYGANVTSTNGSGELVIGDNIRFSSSTSENGRTDTTTGGIGIQLTNIANAAQNSLSFVSNQPGDATTVTGTTIGSVNLIGAWVLGPSTGLGTGSAPYHTITGFSLVRYVSGGSSGGISTDGNGNTELNSNAYIDGAGVLKTISTAGGYSRLLVSSSTTGSSASLRLFSSTGATTANGSAPAATQTLNVTMAGVWSNIAGGSWATISDSRLKENVVAVADGLSVITALRPVTYDWKNPALHVGAPTTSFIAQEVAAVKPEWVSDGAEAVGDDAALVTGATKNLQLSASFNAYLVAAIKELKAQHDTLAADYAAYKVAHP